VRQKNRPGWLLLLRPAAENPRSTLPEQVSQSAEIWIGDPIGVPRCSPQSGTPYISCQWLQVSVMSESSIYVYDFLVPIPKEFKTLSSCTSYVIINAFRLFTKLISAFKKECFASQILLSQVAILTPLSADLMRKLNGTKLLFRSQVHLFSESFRSPHNFFAVVLNYLRTLTIKSGVDGPGRPR
jgi:hypothetical protein